MNWNSEKSIIGIVGGMGPLASAEFLKTVYETCSGTCEQEAPAIVLYSDPSFPDRSIAFRLGHDDILLDRLIRALRSLQILGVSRFIIACVTIHYLLPRLPLDLSMRITSLLDIIYGQLLQRGEKHLLLCTQGTREMEIFQRHPQWNNVQDYIILPEDEDQKLVHDMIYNIKANSNLNHSFDIIHGLLLKYDVRSFIAGCTEIHLISKYLLASRQENTLEIGILDPLIVFAQQLASASMSIPVNKL